MTCRNPISFLRSPAEAPEESAPGMLPGQPCACFQYGEQASHP